jgi:diketogulonate reductase-like aldo/keto reductase
VLKRIAARHDATPAQVALAWLMQQNVVVIPKASTLEHVRGNRGALDLTLTDDDLRELDREFPPPRRRLPLAMI